MSGRRSSSRSQSKQASRRGAPQSERNATGALIFFLIIFLILLVVLLQERISSGQSVLLGIGLLVLSVCMLGIWLARRNQKRAISTAEQGRRRISLLSVAADASGPVTLVDLLRLSPGEFEDFVGDLLEATGRWTNVRRIGGAGDRGADLLAKDRFGRPFIVQCKRYQPGRKVSAGEVRDFLGAKGIYGSDECLFVTTSTFTEAARANIRPFQYVVDLWDGATLLQMVREHWDGLPARWQQSIMTRRAGVD